MRAAIDATPLSVPTGGITRYTSELSQALARNFPQDDFILISDQPYRMPTSGARNLKGGGGPRNRLERCWWTWGLDREMSRMKADLFHGSDFAVPYLSRYPSILTLHDLSPWLASELPNGAWHTGADRVRKRTPVLIALGIATMFITPSEAVRKQAIDRFRIHPERIVAIPLSAPDWGSRYKGKEVAGPWREQDTPYFLYVGTLEPRKNLYSLIEAWRVVREQHRVDLVLAGRRRADFKQLAPEPGLRILGPVSEQDLPELYFGALAFVYPSYYEGFGLPVLEAMQCGACVITSNDPAISEVSAGASIQVNPGDVRALSAAMSAAVSRPEWVQALRAKGIERAREFSWDRTARLTREVYEEARRRFYT